MVLNVNNPCQLEASLTYAVLRLCTSSGISWSVGIQYIASTSQHVGRNRPIIAPGSTQSSGNNWSNACGKDWWCFEPDTFPHFFWYNRYRSGSCAHAMSEMGALLTHRTMPDFYNSSMCMIDV
jgi:hypothetical protein